MTTHSHTPAHAPKYEDVGASPKPAVPDFPAHSPVVAKLKMVGIDEGLLKECHAAGVSPERIHGIFDQFGSASTIAAVIRAFLEAWAKVQEELRKPKPTA